MVGVPRSQGCRICVSRRIKCDRAQPICNNCRKGNRPCPGYGPGVKFQDEGPRLREKYSNESSSSSGKGESEEEDRQPTQALTVRQRVDRPQSTKQWDFMARDVRDGSVPYIFELVEGTIRAYRDFDPLESLRRFEALQAIGQDLPDLDDSETMPVLSARIFSPDLMQFQLFSEFATSMLPNSGYVPRAMRSQGRFYSQIQTLTGTNLLLDAAVRAVTLVHIGLSHHNRTFIVESRPYYGKALRLLANAITDRQMGLCNKTLCATILLSFYEVFAADTDVSWIRHAGGAGALFQMRGPERHRMGFDRDIYLSYRHTLIIEAMSNGVASFLDEPGWRKLSTAIFTDLLANKEIPEDRVALFSVGEQQYQQMVTVSVALAKAHENSCKSEAAGVVLREDLQVAFDRLRTCYDDLAALQQKFHDTLREGKYQPAVLPSGDPVVPTQYQFHNVLLASNHNGFCTTLILINENLRPMAQLLGIDNTQRDAECRVTALEACRCVNYMLVSSFIGPFFTVFALRQALGVFEPGSIERDWVLCKLFEIGDRRMLFAKDLPDAAKKVSPEPLEKLVEKARRRLDEYAARQRVQAA